MRVTIGMIVLNEAEYLARNLAQHYELADSIIIVEGADRLYPADRVSPAGLSTDGTSDIIRGFPDPDNKITYIPHGWTGRSGPQAKCELRNRYMEKVKAGLLAVVDADEFYSHRDWPVILEEVRVSKTDNCWRYPVVHFWHSTANFVTGAYFDIGHTRFWRVLGTERYLHDHNCPSRNRHPLRRLVAHEREIHFAGPGKYQVGGPCCYHLGFCKDPANMTDKTAYYQARGEATSRPVTTRSRAAWFKPASALKAAGVALWPYGGPLPEALKILL